MSYLADGVDRTTGEHHIVGGFRTKASAQRWAENNLETGFLVVREDGGCC